MSINYGSIPAPVIEETPQPKRIIAIKPKKRKIKRLKRTNQLHPKLANLGSKRVTWQPGQSGNPGGRPKNDIAAMIARAVFEQDPQRLENAFFRTLAKGNPKAFTALADRGYGKLTEHLTIDGQVSLSVADRLQQARKRISASNIVTVETIKQENE